MPHEEPKFYVYIGETPQIVSGQRIQQGYVRLLNPTDVLGADKPKDFHEFTPPTPNSQT